MLCIETARRWSLLALGLLGACSSAPPSAPVAARGVETPAPTGTPSTTAKVAAATAKAATVKLAAPAPVRTWAEVRQQAALRMVAADPGGTYPGPVPDILLAIPVLEIELHGDGSIRRIDVLRHPTQARDTVQLAIDAVRRAAPYGDVSRLPKPWLFTETFLFDDNRRFKPRTLDR